MKAILTLLLALAGIAAGGHVRVIVQVIEVPHAALTQWTGGEALAGREIHERAMKLTEAGEAEVVETCVLIARSGQRAVAESIAELIFPSEYNPPGFDRLPLAPMAGGPPASFPHLRPAEVLSTSFETRNTGSTFEIEPMIDGARKLVDLRVGFDLVDRAALATFTEFRDRWGDASVRMPIFDTRRLTSALTLTAGVFDLWNVFTPKPAAVPAATTRQLVFVRADVLPDHPR